MSEKKARNSIVKNTKEPELIITRIFDVPREHDRASAHAIKVGE